MLEDTLRAAIDAELSAFTVNDLAGSVYVRATVQTDIVVPDGWTTTEGDPYIEVELEKEFVL